MAVESAGLLMYRIINGKIEVFLAHPGGPYFYNKGDGFWGIPKGEVKEGEELLESAIREFEEETGLKVNKKSKFIELGTVKMRSGKIVHAWGFEGDRNARKVESNLFEMEWPPKSGKTQEFPEVDRAEFFGIDEAKKKMNARQIEFVLRLIEKLEL